MRTHPSFSFLLLIINPSDTFQWETIWDNGRQMGNRQMSSPSKNKDRFLSCDRRCLDSRIYLLKSNNNWSELFLLEFKLCYTSYKAKKYFISEEHPEPMIQLSGDSTWWKIQFCLLFHCPPHQLSIQSIG